MVPPAQVMDLQELTSSPQDLSPHQRELVCQTLQAILDSPEFSKSARYPTLLRYLVLNTLDGNSHLLKERTIGSAVFNRPPGYDPGVDAVVRTTAGEVRRRMAVFFSEHPDAPVRIELPVGRYCADFHFRPQTPSESSPEQPRIELSPGDNPAGSAAVREPEVSLSSPPTRSRLLMAAGLLLVACAAAALASYFLRRDTKDFWAPVLNSGAPAFIVIGRNPKDIAATPTPSQTGGQSEADDAVTNTAVGNAITAARVYGVFRDYKRECSIIPVQSATLDELRNKTVVSIGGLDNAWTIRLLAPFRYQFGMEGSDPSPRARRIVDQRDPRKTAWNDTSDAPKLTTDYAVIGRFHSDITDGTVVIAAGISQLGTIRAGEYLSSPEQLRGLMDLAPKGWSGFNFEAVLQVDVVQGSPGHVKVIATQFW